MLRQFIVKLEAVSTTNFVIVEENGKNVRQRVVETSPRHLKCQVVQFDKDENGNVDGNTVVFRAYYDLTLEPNIEPTEMANIEQHFRRWIGPRLNTFNPNSLDEAYSFALDFLMDPTGPIGASSITDTERVLDSDNNVVAERREPMTTSA